MSEWSLDHVQKDSQSVTADWALADPAYIDGVRYMDIRSVPKEGGWVTEVFRTSWQMGAPEVDQIFTTTLFRGAVSAWHAHKYTADRLFAASGMVKVVLYDATVGSPTHGMVNTFRIGVARPGLVVIPPGIWHGVQVIGDDPAVLVNAVDRAYDYEDPDHWRLPWDTDQIPHRFAETPTDD